MHSLTIWLFLDDLFHQILFYFGTVVAMGILLYEKRRNKTIEWRWIASFFLFCLFASCFQAWIDEHHNSERLIEDKKELSRQADFWKEQSFAKDEGIRSRDTLLFGDLKTLGAAQQTENQTQQLLTNLAGKILDVTKPETLMITNRSMAVRHSPNAPPNPTNTGILIAETNRRIGAFSGKIVCQSAFAMQQVTMLQGMISQSPSYTQHRGQTTLNLDFSGSAWDVQQPIIAIILGNNLDVDKCSIMRQ